MEIKKFITFEKGVKINSNQLSSKVFFLKMGATLLKTMKSPIYELSPIILNCKIRKFRKDE